MVHRCKSVKIAGSPDYLLYSWIAELNYLARLDVNKMIMLAALVCPFELRNVLSELVLDNKVAVQK